MSIALELKTYLLDAIGKWSGFLRNMTENTTHFKPPLGLFGKFIVETKGKYKDAMDIKYAILPIIDFARIYALHNGISQTNTLERLFRLYTRHALTGKEYTDLTQGLSFPDGPALQKTDHHHHGRKTTPGQLYLSRQPVHPGPAHAQGDFKND